MWYFKQDVQNNSSVLFLVSVEETVAPPGFCNRGEVRYGSIGGLEYKVPQKLTHLLHL